MKKNTMINLSPQKTNNNKKKHKRKIVRQSKVKNYPKKKILQK